MVGEVDPTGNYTASQEYDVYGAVRASTQTGSFNTRQGYVGQLGHQTDPETGGLIYMQARYYDPSTGRFVSEDPGMDGNDWYLYANDSPTNFLDSNGKVVIIVAAIAIVALALIAVVAMGIGFMMGWNWFANTFIGDSDPTFPRYTMSGGAIGFGGATVATGIFAWLFRGAMYGRGIGAIPLLRTLGIYAAVAFIIGFSLGALSAEIEEIARES